MLSSLRLRILIITLMVITLALTINASVSYLTLQTHNDQQVTQQLASIAQGNALAIEEWVDARVAILEAARTPVIDNDPLAPLVQLAESGGFLTAFFGQSDGRHLSSDGWVPGSDFDPRQREWYQAATKQDRTIVSLPYVDANSNQLVVSFATPVKRNGRLYGVIGGDVVIDNLVSQVNAIRPTPSSFAFLSSGGETVIAHPDAALTLQPLSRISDTLSPASIEQLSAAPDTWEPINVDGLDKRLSVTPIAGTDWELGVALDEHEATAGLRAILKSSLLTLIVIIAVTALLLSLWLKRAFAGLERARDALDDIASGEGDLTRRLPEQGSDEVAQICGAFNRFVGKMEAVLVDVRTSSDSVHHAANEIALGGQDLSRRTDNAASSLQQTSASIEQITSTVEHTAASAQEANKLSQTATNVAKEGGQVVANVVTTMEDISQASHKIGEIVTLMNSIAFQTNLLALNASVEAARAGEHGRGFAVVADEVRKLAGRSSEAANDIQKLIEDSQSRVNNGTVLVQNAGATMQDIVAHITRVTDVLEEINSATSEQSDGIKQINIAVSELDRMTQENAAMVEESTTAAEQLKEQADHLKGTISSFKLSQHPSAPLTISSTSALPSY
ncbi:methyl-accepting chemotaxis protein [Vreelandella venusta]|uniref:Chemotaxis protein n=1 Tax=Vreelandella venusta TaxID=44935 RepID=A0ABX2BEX3_9GAMM|nr:methyl-accepting chemotaxis protein [Halomonas venusta]AZM97699.1 methyl-accepting chemotaxis protein [Halomonas venusta]MDW0360046.1 methyl-accepting chemotaxis protein [Halomonas venusta]NPT31140.1 chemotaxis protein [Halomonas venusta]WAM48473.1 methyl-accepting chemotaxis protein [Halomonas venusta]